MTVPAIAARGTGHSIPLPHAMFEQLAAFCVGSETYSAGEVCAEPGFKGPGMHVHEHHTEIFYGVEGEFRWFVGEQRTTMVPGSVLVVPAGTPHNFVNATDRSARLFAIACPDEIDEYDVERRSDEG